MKRTLLLSALIAATLVVCGKKELQVAAPATPPAPQAQAAAQPATPADAAPAPAEQKPEEKK